MGLTALCSRVLIKEPSCSLERSPAVKHVMPWPCSISVSLLAHPGSAGAATSFPVPWASGTGLQA